MERVPQIRLFGTSQSWKNNHQPYNKKYTETWSGDSSGFNYTSQKPIFQRTIQRSNSLNQLNSSKPSHTNYYQNAVRICEQNKLLNKVKGHRLEYLTGQYLVRNHRQVKNNKPCTICQAQNISKKIQQNRQQKVLNQQQIPNSYFVKSQIPTPSYNYNQQNYFQNAQNTTRTNKQSITNYITQKEQKLSTNRSNQNFLQHCVAQMHKTSSKVVSFRQIANNQPVIRNIQGNVLTNQINTERRIYNQGAILQSKCESLTNKGIKNRCDANLLQNNLLPQISQLISQLGKDDSIMKNTAYMLRDLEEITYRHLERRKSCINELDKILYRADYELGSESGQNKFGKESLTLQFKNDQSICSDNRSLSSRRRNKIF